MTFLGFSRTAQYTPIPNVLLGTLLKDIDNLEELKCTLRILGLLHKKRGHPRFVTSTELMNDDVLLGLSNSPQAPIERGLNKAVNRGTLICLRTHQTGHVVDIYLLNTDSDRKALENIKEGRIPIGVTNWCERTTTPSHIPKPNIFRLYEENVGLIAPLVAEELKDAEQTYPDAWIQEAFKIATQRNHRSWHYIESILNRWATQGKDDGKSRRYTKKIDRKEYLREYIRRRGRLPGE